MEHSVIETLVTKAAQFTLFVLMLGMGLNLSLNQLAYLWRQKGLLLRVIVASFILVPIAAVIVVHFLPLTAPVKIGIALMALTPGAPLIYRRVSQMGWNSVLAASYQVTVSLLAVVFLPAMLILVNRLYVNQGETTSLDIFKQILAVQFIPLAIGLAIRAGLRDLANEIEGFVIQIGNVMFLALGVLILVIGVEKVLSAGILPILAITLIAALTLAIGHLLGGPDPTNRATLAVASTMRNAGLALVITILNFSRAEILPTIIVYALISAIASAIYHSRYKRRLVPLEAETSESRLS